MDDIVANEMMSRVFGRVPPPPTTGIPGRSIQASDDIRAIAQGDGSSQLSNPMPGVSPVEAARADLLVNKLAGLFQNANITAALPAYNEPTWWSQPLDMSGSVSLAAAQSTYQTVLTYTCPVGLRFRINGYGVNVQDPAYTYNGSILWRIRKNGVDVPFLADWGQQRGSIVQPRETFIILEPQDIIQFQVRRAVAALASQTVEMTLTGYSWKPRKDYEGYRSAVNAQ
jgi:hypothetical protein